MEFFLVKILAFLFLVRSEAFEQSRINMGYPIDIEQAPYMAKLFLKFNETNGSECGGSILSDQYILTAGHCKCRECSSRQMIIIVSSARCNRSIEYWYAES